MDGGLPIVSTDQASGDLLIDESGPASPMQADQVGHFENLCGVIEDDTKDTISNSLTSRISEDERNSEEFIALMADHTTLLGIGPESEPDDLAYENSDTSDSTLLLTALVRFQSKAMAAIIPQPRKACRAEGLLNLADVPDIRMRHQMKTQMDGITSRVEDYYADYLFSGDQSYQEDTDRILYECGLHGISIRKVYNDMSRDRNKTRLDWVPIQNMIISYDAKSMRCGRVAEKIDLTTSDLIRKVASGEYVGDDLVPEADVEKPDKLTEAQNRVAGLAPNTATGSTHRMYEIYADLFLDADPNPTGLARPYVITVHQPTQKIVSIKRNWQENDPDERRIETFVAYIYSPGKRANTGLGLGHLLANVTRALRRGQRRGFDAAYLQNMPFGYKLSSMSIRDEGTKVIPGEFIDVDSPTDDIRSALQMNMFQGPSQGLMTLIDKLEANGKELGGIAALDFSQLMKSGVTAAPALAALEETTEFQSAIHRRLYDAQALEMRLLHDRTKEVLANQPVLFGEQQMLQPTDLTSVRLIPVMKPGFVSKQKAVLEGRALKEAADEAPDVIDVRKATQEYARSLGRADIEDFLLPPPEEAPPPQPADPVKEYTMILEDQPVAAGLSQNHQAHIDTHSSQMRMIETSGMPIEDGEKAMAQLAAHIVDHHAKMMIMDIASKIGIPPEQFEQGIPPEMEGQVAMAIAQATKATEEERRPPEDEPEDSKIDIERTKIQGKLEQLSLEQRHERETGDLKHRQALELQKAKDDAEMERALQDDDTAMAIAKLNAEAGGKDRPRAGTISS